MTLSQDIIKELREKLDYKKKEREALLDQISLVDVSIDKIDTIVANIDKQIPPLLNEINDAIDAVKSAYDNRIAIGCRSNLIWNSSSAIDRFKLNSGGVTSYHVCAKNDAVKISTPYYAYKYYKKPINRDYGFNISGTFSGNISVGSTILGVVSLGGTTGIGTGDEITDDLEAPTVFSIGTLPSIVGFGVTTIVGLTTEFEGTISVGSSILASVGIGSTGDVPVGSGIGRTGIIANDTTVVGYGTTSLTVSYYDANISEFISTSVSAKTLILSKIAIASTSTSIFNVGVVTVAPSLILSTSANSSAYNQFFSAIRKTTDIDSDFDFTKNPVDPITIGIIDTTNFGSGHQSLVVNNGYPNITTQWSEIKEDSEPSVGGGAAVYYSGNTQWPTYRTCSGTIPSRVCTTFFASEGTEFVGIGTLGSIAGYASTSPLNPSVNTCNAATAAITTAESILQATIDKNLPKAKALASQATALRRIRDEKELEAWSLLQGAAYTRKTINELTDDLNALTSTDFSQFE